ncbi:hypothetical protein CAEBREN_17154 [Caenorhabditis brenneri]|uniref:Uncharacterized protein n=1 Tax=Caenorhabditis brenneri TaxID=135651 RepID=G0N738_CAEBE|nr:hypothetical protein CAEBREN_17154 [Caenorhabditis brenneri]
MWPPSSGKPGLLDLPRSREIYAPHRMSEPITSPTKHSKGTSPSKFSPPQTPKPMGVGLMEEAKKVYKKFNFGVQKCDPPPITTAHSSPAKLVREEAKELPEDIEQEDTHSDEERERIEAIKRQWIENGFTNPEDWPRLKVASNYDEDPKLQKTAAILQEDIRKFRRCRLRTGNCKKENDEDEDEHDNKDTWAVIEEFGSEDNRFEASELIEYKDHDWCVALRICREKTEKNSVQLLVYSYQCGIQRLKLTTEQMNSLGETLLLKYKTKADGSCEVLPIYSALPSTGLVSLKYRNNKGIELRIYGISNFVDFDKDPDAMAHKTMIWTDPIGPIYLTSADRSNIRRKLMMTESKTFAPLRMCQITVKGEFSSIVSNGTFLKWTISSFTPLIEEAPKDPSIGRNLWPARVIRLEDLVKDQKAVPRTAFGQFHQTQTGIWLKSLSEPSLKIYAGAHLTGILNSAGPKYSENGIMMAYVVPSFEQNKFSYYEALIVGPPRVVMIITEGRFLNYYPKTFTPLVQKLTDEYVNRKEAKKQVTEPPIIMKQPEHRLKSVKGFEEFHFDF